MQVSTDEPLIGTKKIKIRLEKLHLSYREPMQTYTRLVGQLGEERVYILESIDGPEQYSRFGYIGFDPLLRLSCTERRLEIYGISELSELIKNLVLCSRYVVEDGGLIMLNEEGDIWDIMRLINSTFDIIPKQKKNEFSFGWFSSFGYDAVHHIESIPRSIERKNNWPDIEFTLYRGVIFYDTKERTMQVTLGHQDKYWKNIPGIVYVESINDLQDHTDDIPTPNGDFFAVGTMSRQDYLSAVETAKKYILNGDIYQIQIGHSINISSSIKPIDVYYRLRNRNPSPFMYFAPLAEGFLIGASPELHIRCDGESISMRPIAGTAPRGNTREEDDSLIDDMRNSEKEVAEHIMLVDLCRNDLAKVAIPGTLQVDEMMEIESYSHVHHLVSSVSANLNTNYDVYDVIRATFPAGTMTGAPKVRSMEIIEELETSSRGPYAGAVGLIDLSGFAELALCIRSATYLDGEYSIRASAGVVFDSQPVNEWEETLHKMGAAFWAITGKELKHARITY